MPKRSFSIPDEVDTYIKSIPKSQRSKFVSHALIEAMKDQKKKKLLQLIENFDCGEPSRLSTVEMVRQLRDEESKRQNTIDEFSVQHDTAYEFTQD